MSLTKSTSIFALFAILATFGCASSGNLGWFGKAKTPSLSFGTIQPKPNPMVAAVTDNPVTRAVQKGVKWATLKPRVEGVPDPTSLSMKTPAPSPAMYITMANLQADTGNIENAISQFEKALSLDATDLEANLGLAHLYDRQGRLVEATEYYRLAIKHHSDSARSHNDLGLCLAKQGKHEESSELLRGAIRLDPHKKLYRNNVATVLVELGQLGEAFGELTQAHGSAIANYNLGYLLHQRGQSRLAKVYFARAVRIDPAMLQAKSMLARLHGPPPSQTQPKTRTPRIATRPTITRTSVTPGPPSDTSRPATNSSYRLRPESAPWDQGAQDDDRDTRYGTIAVTSASATESDDFEGRYPLPVKLPPVLP